MIHDSPAVLMAESVDAAEEEAQSHMPHVLPACVWGTIKLLKRQGTRSPNLRINARESAHPDFPIDFITGPPHYPRNPEREPGFHNGLFSLALSVR